MTTLARWSSLGLLALSLGACNDSKSSSVATGTTGATGATTTPVVITITGMNGASSFSPNPAKLLAGQSVVWQNADTVAHTATEDDSGFDTSTIAPGASSKPITLSVGSHHYHCSIHPSMVGTLDVVP